MTENHMHNDRDSGIKFYTYKNFSRYEYIDNDNYYTIGYLEEGSLFVTFKLKSFEVPSDTFFFINPGDLHYFSSPNGLSFRAWYIPLGAMAAITTRNYHFSDLPLFLHPFASGLKLKQSFFQLHQLYRDESHITKRKKKSLFSAFICTILDEHAQFKNPRKHSEKIISACSYMKANYAKKVCTDELCSYLGIKPSAFYALFEKEMGVSPHRYLTSIRINAAIKYLNESKGGDVGQIAVKTGFCDHSHLTRVFRSVTGITPKKYRESISLSKSQGI